MSTQPLGTTPFRAPSLADGSTGRGWAVGWMTRMSRPGGRGTLTGVEESPDSVERRWWLTATHGDVRDSATEIKPPTAPRGTGKGETVR